MFICLSLIVCFLKYLCQNIPFPTENWDASSHAQYFLKQVFFYISDVVLLKSKKGFFMFKLIFYISKQPIGKVYNSHHWKLSSSMAKCMENSFFCFTPDTHWNAKFVLAKVYSPYNRMANLSLAHIIWRCYHHYTRLTLGVTSNYKNLSHLNF